MVFQILSWVQKLEDAFKCKTISDAMDLERD